MGINLRPELLDEIIRKEPDFPFLEIIVDNWFSPGPHHQKLLKLRERYDLFFHCVGMNLGGIDPIDTGYLSKVKELSSIYNPIHISDHLCFQAVNNQHFHDLLPFPLNNESLREVESRILQVQDLLKVPILIENLSYYVEFQSSTMSEIEFINQLLQKTQAYLLFDINNIWVNQLNLGIPMSDYMDRLPWDRVKEIHIAGPERVKKLYIDTHASEPDHRTIDLLYKFRAHLTHIPIIYERDNKIPSLENLLKTALSVKSSLERPYVPQ